MKHLVLRPSRRERAYPLNCPGPHPDTEVRDAGGKGMGLFATRNLRRGTCVGCYLGVLVSASRHEEYSEHRAAFCMEFKHSGLVIDAFHYGTQVRFANHSFQPNAAIHWEVHGEVYHPALRLGREVKEGEEICYNYGRKYWKNCKKTPIN